MIKFLRPAFLPCVAIGIAVVASQGYAQTSTTLPDTGMVDASSRAQIVNALADEVLATYVFPDVAESLAKALKTKLKEGGYDSVKYADGLAAVLTRDLQLVNHDLHLLVTYSADPLPVRGPGNAPSVEEEATTLQLLKASNFGVGTIERLPGNIGYLQMTEFAPAKYTHKAISTAMTRLASNDALIIDLRQNDGGEPETVALLSSYLFDKRTHLNDLHWREGARIEQLWTNEKVSGRKLGQSKPVYVLMGKRTCSAAEEFSYNLQSLKRATIVGEATCGGAHHSSQPTRLNAHFYADIPMARAVNPITKTNWEGTGVKPDVPASNQTALVVAQKLAVEALSATEKTKLKLQALRARLSELDSQLAQATGPTK